MYKMMTLIVLAELRENALISKNLCQIMGEVKLNLQTSLGEFWIIAVSFLQQFVLKVSTLGSSFKYQLS